MIYELRADDQQSESLFAAYQERRGEVQTIAGQMYINIQRAEAAYATFEAQLLNEYAPLAAYHNAKQAPVAQAVTLLRSKMAEVAGLMEQMQAAMPEGIILFPGVPTQQAQPIEDGDNASED
jgi:hypothetical protein